MKPQEAKDEIRKYSRGELRDFWAFIRDREKDQIPNPGFRNHQVVPDKDPPRWDGGQAFEFMMLRFFELDGAEVTYPYGPIVGLDGLTQETDGFIYTDKLRCLVESKDWSSPVKFSTVAKLKDRLLHRNSQLIGCIFCSRSGFSTSALTAAFLEQTRYNILLWGRDEIDFVVKSPRSNFVEALHTKYRYSLEKLIPYFDTSAGQEPPASNLILNS